MVCEFQSGTAGLSSTFSRVGEHVWSLGGSSRVRPQTALRLHLIRRRRGRAFVGHWLWAPEMVLISMDTPNANGYSRSKFLSELLCEAVAKHLDLLVTIARVGQVAVAVRRPGAVWNRSEWFPSLTISSFLRLVCLPDTLGRRFSDIDWVPSDVLAGRCTPLSIPKHGALAGHEAAVPASLMCSLSKAPIKTLLHLLLCSRLLLFSSTTQINNILFCLHINSNHHYNSKQALSKHNPTQTVESIVDQLE